MINRHVYFVHVDSFCTATDVCLCCNDIPLTIELIHNVGIYCSNGMGWCWFYFFRFLFIVSLYFGVLINHSFKWLQLNIGWFVYFFKVFYINWTDGIAKTNFRTNEINRKLRVQCWNLRLASQWNRNWIWYLQRIKSMERLVDHNMFTASHGYNNFDSVQIYNIYIISSFTAFCYVLWMLRRTSCSDWGE